MERQRKWAGGVGLAGLIWLVSGCDGSKPAPASGGGGAATAPLDYLAAQGQAKRTSQKVVDLAQVQQALKLFEAAEDRRPRDLSELVKAGYLAAVPQPPPGQVLRYDPATGEVRMVRTP